MERYSDETGNELESVSSIYDVLFAPFQPKKYVIKN